MTRHIPNFLTSLNLVIGCVGIYVTLTDQSLEAFYFVIIAGLFDFLDGFAARLLKVQSEIGKQLDSLSDLVSFGLLPAFFMAQTLKESSDLFWLAFSIAVFSALRLAKFNVDDSQSDSFRGLPTPANAIMLTSLIFLPYELYEYTLLSICIFSSIMLVSPIRLVALKFKSASWKGNEARWLLIVGVLGLVLALQTASFPYLIPFYISLSVISFAFQKRG